MKYQIDNYPYFPEKWPYPDMHYRLTFVGNIPQSGPDFFGHPFIHDAMHKTRLTEMLLGHLNLWEIRTDLTKQGWLHLYCNTINWFALVKLACADDPFSPIHSLRRLESWETRSNPLLGS